MCFHCGSRDQLVWGQIKRRELEELSFSLQTAAKAMKHRVIAKSGGLRQVFSCFALRRIHRLEEAIGEEKDTLRRKLYESVVEFANKLQIDYLCCVLNGARQLLWR